MRAMTIDLYWAASLGKWVTVPDAKSAAPEDAAGGSEVQLNDANLAIGGATVKIGKRFYGDWVIYRDPPPIPVRDCDWHFYHKDFDGAPDSGDNRSGSAASLADAITHITDMEDDA